MRAPGLAASLVVLGLTIVVSGRSPALSQAPASQTPAPRPGLPGQPSTPDRAVSAPGSARISGRVTAADTGAPLRRAQLTLRAAGSPQPFIVATDEQGRYTFEELPPGRYTLVVTRSGYVTLSYAQHRPTDGARPIEVTAGQVIDRVDFSLPPGGIIIARVTDDLGEPISGSSVRAQQYRYVSGERQLMGVSSSPLFGATDDRGFSRLHGLPPGEYYVSAAADTTAIFGAQGLTFAPTYYPGTTAVTDAQRVAVAAGQEVTITFPLAATRVARISGTIVTSRGEPPSRASIWMRDETRGALRPNIGVQAGGRFEIRDLYPGLYSLSVLPPVSGGPVDASDEFGSMQVRIEGEDVENLVITTRRGAAIHGQLVFEDGSLPGELRPGAFALNFPAAAGTFSLATPSVTWHEDWSFDLIGFAGSRLVRLGPQQSAWYLKAVMLDGRDVTDMPLQATDDVLEGLQVVVTRRRTEVSGNVVDARGAQSTDYVAVVFSPDRERWGAQSRFVSAGRPDQTGRFQILGLPAGDYLAVAVTVLESGAERDPEVLERLTALASPLTLSDGGTRTITLRLATF